MTRESFLFDPSAPTNWRDELREASTQERLDQARATNFEAQSRFSVYVPTGSSASTDGDDGSAGGGGGSIGSASGGGGGSRGGRGLIFFFFSGGAG